MRGPEPSHDVVLYGATGYTGRLIAQELDAARINTVLVGRNPARLEQLSSGLAARPATKVARLDRPDELDAAMKSGRIAISAAGPFATMGPPIVNSCLRTRTPMLDVTGEQAYLRWCVERHAEAQQAEIPIVNAMGFDVVPSDVAATIASTAMPHIEHLDLAIKTNARFSGGTRRSMAAAGGRGWWYHRGRFRMGPPGRFRRTFRFPTVAADGTLVREQAEREHEAIFIPWGDIVTAPRSTGAHTVRTFFVTKPHVVRRFHRAWPLTAALAHTPGVSALLRRKMGRGAPESGHGPDAHHRHEAQFSIVAEATGEGTVQRGMVVGRDPYGLTAAAVVEGAKRVLAGGVPPGVLTPTQAFPFGPLCAALQERFGLQWFGRSLADR